MNSNSSMLLTDTDHSVATHPFREYLGVNYDDLILSCFLEQSAKYLGVYCEQDPFELKDDSYLIN